MTTDSGFLAVDWQTDESGIIRAVSGQGPETVPIGGMETKALAEEACTAHNERLASRKAARRGVHGSSGVQFGHGNSQTNVF